MDTTLKKVIGGWLISLLVLVPLVIWPLGTIKEVLFVGGVALAALGWLWLSISAEEPLFRLNLTSGVLAFNLAVWVLSLLLSDFPNEGLPTLSARVAGLGLLLLAPRLLDRRWDLALALALLLGTAALMSIYGILQFLGLDPLFRTSGLVGHFRVSSTAVHPNFFITFLVACVPLNLAAFRLFSGRARNRLLLGLSLVLCLGAAVATLSRAGWAAMGLAVVVAAVGLWWAGRGQPRETAQPRPAAGEGGGRPLKLVVALSLAAAVLLVGVLLSRGTMDPGERERLLSLTGSTTQQRLLVYRTALSMAADAPILGQGLGTFGLYVPAYRPPELAAFFPRNEYQVAHAVSEPLEVLAESGALGLLAWLLLVAVLVGRPLWALGRVSDPGLRAVLVGASAGTLGVVAHGMVEVCLRHQPPLFMFWALPALALAAERAGSAGDEPGRPVTPKSWVGRLGQSVLIGMVFGLVFAITLSNFGATLLIRSGRGAQARGDVAGAELALRRAQAAWTGNLEARYRRAYTLWKLGHLDRAEAAYREVLRRSPYYFDAQHNLGRVLLARGELDKARKWADSAVRLNPYHVPSHELAVRVAIKQGRLQDARRLALHIFKVANHHEQSFLTLARVQLARGRLRAARQTLRQAAARFPESKEVRRMLRTLR